MHVYWQCNPPAIARTSSGMSGTQRTFPLRTGEEVSSARGSDDYRDHKLSPARVRDLIHSLHRRGAELAFWFGYLAYGIAT